MTAFRLDALESRHRSRLAEILAETGAFSGDEIAVALELFDETFGEGRGARREGGASVAGEPGRCATPSLTAPSPPSLVAPPPSSYEFVGAFDDDTLVGYACYGATPGTDGTFDLYWIAVHPSAQGGGEGSRLLGEVEGRLGSRGGRLLVVETSSRDAYEPTRRFYGSRGYREAARITDFYAPADDRVIYTKRLTPMAQAAHPLPRTTDQRGARHHE